MVSLGVAVRPIWVADEKYSRISRQAESAAAAAETAPAAAVPEAPAAETKMN